MGSSPKVKGDANDSDTEHRELRTRSRLSRGTATSGGLSAGALLPKSVRVRDGLSRRTGRLFVSNVRPEVTAEDFFKQISESSSNSNVLSVHKLISSRDDISSFCVVVPQEYFDGICCPEVWEKDILFKPYNGLLRQEKISETFKSSPGGVNP